MNLEDLIARRDAADGEYRSACEAMQTAVALLDDDAVTDLDEFRSRNAAAREAADHAEALKAALADVQQLVDDAEILERARKEFKPQPRPQNAHISIVEPDTYVEGGRSFIGDLYRSQRQGDLAASKRIQDHHQFEVERYYGDTQLRATATATLGGIIPPQYLVSLYAKAARNGRVYANQVNHQPLPDEGMSAIVPRLTAGTTAGVQTSENTTVVTQDPTETDLSVPVRTVAGFIAVSRQTLERARYSEGILMEDLGARYAQNLDLQCLTGTGASGQILGVTNTSGTSSSVTSTATVAGVWTKFSDCIQQIETAVGGIGYHADKIVMHPRRWGFFGAGLDSNNRPLYAPASMTFGPGWEVMNGMAEGGAAAAYGFTGAQIQGLPVFTDANIPTNLGAGTNQDIIIVMASQAVHLWERPEDPVTLSFEQQAGTSLQTQLVAYGYAAYTCGRYPAATAVISGTGLVTPTF